MKIQIQNTSFYPTIGGIENYMYYVSQELIKANHHPIILCSRERSKLPIRENFKSIEIIRHRHVVPFSYIPIYDIIHYRWLRKVIIDAGLPDIIWSRHPYYCYASCKAEMNIPIIYIQATAFPMLHKYSYKTNNIFKNSFNAIRNKEDFLLEKYAMEKCNKIVVLSHMRKIEIKDYYDFDSKKFEVIYPGIDLIKYKPRNKDENLMRELGIMPGSKVILCIARIQGEKNIAMLIEAFIKIKIEELYLVIVGDGPLKDKLINGIKGSGYEKKIIFTGFRYDVERFYSIADIFILLSKYEGFGHVYLEAMASGVPCIALRSDYPNIIVATQEIIIEGRTGYCVSPYDVGELIDKIQMLIYEEKLRDDMGITARRICEKKYSWKNHVRSLLDISNAFL